MEGEMKIMRKELETTKKALKVQTARCRHLVAAFTRKLADKDAEVKACRELREKQLSSLLRALLVLEARLKREQKCIKVMLADKDNMINNQKLEIQRLRAEVKVQEESPVKEKEEETKLEEEPEVAETSLREVYAKPDLISSLGINDLGKEGGPDSLSSDSTRSCLGDESDYTVVVSPQVKGVLNVHDRSAFSPITKGKQESRLAFSPFSKSAPDVSKSTQDDFPSQPSPMSDIQMSNRSDKYQDNPVLQCVNQILLKDQEDFLEEQRSKNRDPRRHSVWMDEDDSPLDEELQDEGRSPTPPQHQPAKKSASLTDLNGKEKTVRMNPPLPPKPKKVEFADVKPPAVQFHNSVAHQTVQPIDHIPLGIPLSMLDPIDRGHDNDLYVISNSALDDEIVKQLRGRTLNVTGLHIKSPRMNTERNQHSNVPTGLIHPNHKPHQTRANSLVEFSNTNVLFTPPKSPSASVLKVSIQESPKRTSFGFKSPPKVGMPNMIKVASPVATLLTSGANGSPSKEELSPSVSQMVRRFEDLGTKKQEDEESKKGDKSDKEESPNVSTVESSPSTVSYDKFLEATGLSQKSIITPSRLMTNHRNVTKPKDVKHRSHRVRTSGVIERCIPPQVVGPTIKYWTEPFL